MQKYAVARLTFTVHVYCTQSLLKQFCSRVIPVIPYFQIKISIPNTTCPPKPSHTL